VLSNGLICSYFIIISRTSHLPIWEITL
jgi:hypothetical protein